MWAVFFARIFRHFEYSLIAIEINLKSKYVKRSDNNRLLAILAASSTLSDSCASVLCVPGTLRYLGIAYWQWIVLTSGIEYSTLSWNKTVREESVKLQSERINVMKVALRSVRHWVSSDQLSKHNRQAFHTPNWANNPFCSCHQPTAVATRIHHPSIHIGLQFSVDRPIATSTSRRPMQVNYPVVAGTPRTVWNRFVYEADIDSVVACSRTCIRCDTETVWL